ncbi:MAG: TIGR03618 family F420-dependent PPOX class oxidoreductase [Candidatus Limnocylindrales bacterium]
MSARATTVPDELLDLVTTDCVAHVASINPDGSISSHILWVDWDGEHLLMSTPVGSVKVRNWRHDPQVGISVADKRNPWRSLQMSGRVSEIRPDEDLALIDRLSQRYEGRPYADREGAREVIVVSLDRVRAALG